MSYSSEEWRELEKAGGCAAFWLLSRIIFDIMWKFVGGIEKLPVKTQAFCVVLPKSCHRNSKINVKLTWTQTLGTGRITDLLLISLDTKFAILELSFLNLHLSWSVT